MTPTKPEGGANVDGDKTELRAYRSLGGAESLRLELAAWRARAESAEKRVAELEAPLVDVAEVRAQYLDAQAELTRLRSELSASEARESALAALLRMLGGET